MSKRKLHRNPSEPNELKTMALAGESFCHVQYETISMWADADVLSVYFRKQRRHRYIKIS